MNRIPVTSSQIHAVGYDPQTQTMEIEFTAWNDKPRNVYLYSNVTPEDHAAFIGAESLGRHFGSVIKCNPGKFPYQKLQ